jgi:hypothetical protein
MGMAPMTSDSPVIGQDVGASNAAESACADDAPFEFEKDDEPASGTTLDCDDEVTVVVSKGRLWLLRKRMPLRILTALGIVTVGLLATGMLRRTIARHPASAQRSSLPSKASSGATPDQPAANLPSPTVPARATTAMPAGPKAAQPALADSPVPIVTGSAASGEKPSRTTPNITPQAPQAHAQGNAALAACQDALVKKDTAAITQSCDSALEIDATLAMPILAWAKRELDRGNIKVAVAWARRLLKADDHLADAYLIVGVAEQAASRGSAAKTAYRRYLELAPKGRYARDVRSSLAAL